MKSYFDKIKNRPNLHIIMANIGWLFFDRILRMGVGLYITLAVARYLGVTQFGVFNYAAAFAGMFLPVATLGLDAVAVHYLVSDISSKKQMLSTVFLLRLVGGLLSILLAVSTVFIFRHNEQSTIILVAILAGVGIIQPFDTIDIWFQSQIQSKYTVIAKNTAFLLAALVRISLISYQAPLITFAIANLLESGLGAIGLVAFFKAKDNSLELSHWDNALAKELLKKGWPLILSSLSVMIYMRIDQIMLGEIIGEKAVGIYSAATRISEVWYFIPVAISSSVAPSIYAAKKISEKLYYERIKNFIRAMVVISIAIAIPMTFLSSSIIVSLFSNEYIDSAPILSVHIWAAVFVFMGVATSPWFIAENLTHISFNMTLLGAITNILLNFVMIPYWQGMGAAIATVISYAISAFLANSFDQRTRKIFNIQIKSILITAR